MSDLVRAGLFFLAALPAIVFHEVAHGWVASLLGDPTARNAGRLTLNPLKHIDPFGTLLLPALLALAGAPVFGYAKPVPINPYFFRGNKRVGLMLVGLAGPATNLVLAIVVGLFVRFAAPAASALTGTALIVAGVVVSYLLFLAQISLVLMFFNLIPIPPFDGSRVLPLFLSDSGMRVYAQVERYGFLILIALLWIVPQLLHVDPLGAYFGATVTPLMRLIVGV